MFIILLIITFTILIGLLGGFLAQTYCLWVDGKNMREKPSSSILIPWFIKTKYLIFKIRLFSVFRTKEKFYVTAMKRKLIHGKLEMALYQGLMREKRGNIQPVLEAVFHVMEKNRRQTLNSTNKKFEKHFFIRNVYIERGFGYGMRLTEYCVLFVLYNRYLKGEYLTPDLAEKGAKLFGVANETKAANIDTDILIKNIKREEFFINRGIEKKLTKRRLKNKTKEGER